MEKHPICSHHKIEKVKVRKWEHTHLLADVDVTNSTRDIRGNGVWQRGAERLLLFLFISYGSAEKILREASHSCVAFGEKIVYFWVSGLNVCCALLPFPKFRGSPQSFRWLSPLPLFTEREASRRSVLSVCCVLLWRGQVTHSLPQTVDLNLIQVRAKKGNKISKNFSQRQRHAGTEMWLDFLRLEHKEKEKINPLCIPILSHHICKSEVRILIRGGGDIQEDWREDRGQKQERQYLFLHLHLCVDLSLEKGVEIPRSVRHSVSSPHCLRRQSPLAFLRRHRRTSSLTAAQCNPPTATTASTTSPRLRWVSSFLHPRSHSLTHTLSHSLPRTHALALTHSFSHSRSFSLSHSHDVSSPLPSHPPSEVSSFLHPHSRSLALILACIQSRRHPRQIPSRHSLPHTLSPAVWGVYSLSHFHFHSLTSSSTLRSVSLGSLKYPAQSPEVPIWLLHASFSVTSGHCSGCDCGEWSSEKVKN